MARIASLRYLLVFRLILYAGESVDIKDILNLERKDVDFDNNTILIKKKIREVFSYFYEASQKLSWTSSPTFIC